jgi:ABC-type transporter Mla subunit MlaD
MAHEASVQALQQIEQNFQHVIDLLNQADQDVREAKVANTTFGEAHHFNPPHGHALDDAISSIENVLGQATSVHNEAMARLREAQAHAASLEDEAAESESSQ